MLSSAINNVAKPLDKQRANERRPQHIGWASHRHAICSSGTVAAILAALVVLVIVVQLSYKTSLHDMYALRPLHTHTHTHTGYIVGLCYSP